MARFKNSYFETTGWRKAEHITIQSEGYLEKLLSNGFEIQGSNFKWMPNKSSVTLYLKGKKRRLIADANDIDEYVIHLQDLYDFDKKKTRFTWVPDTSIYWNFQDKLIQMLTGEYKKPILKKKMDSALNQKILRSLRKWVESKKEQLMQENGLSSIFSQVCIVNEDINGVVTKEISKQIISLESINKINQKGRKLINSIALSFFYLTRKEYAQNINDFIVGSIIYDLKNTEILCFNLNSTESASVGHNLTPVYDGFYNIALTVFNESVDEDGFKSFIPLPLDSPWYTALPWFSYSVLSNLDSKIIVPSSNSDRINIAELFTFGRQASNFIGNSFDYRPFSFLGGGYATCIFNILANSKPLTYTIRYDQSRGQPLVHLDYSVYNGKNETKLINHLPLDLVAVYNFSEDLYIAITGAGLFDGYFTTCLRKGIKGSNELFMKNPAFLYSLTVVYKLDKYINWLNRNSYGYVILEKLFYNQSLSEMEKKFLSRMSRVKIDAVAKDEDSKIGLNYFGYMVLQRYKRGQSHISISNIDANVRSKKTEVIKLFEKWLRDERYLFERTSQFNVDYICTLNTMPTVHILIQKDRIDRIDLGTDIRLVNNEGKSIFMSMNKSKLKQVLNSLQVELLQFPVLCTFRPSLDNIERVQIRNFIYFDGLTKDRFFSAIHQIIRVYALISARLGELIIKRNHPK